MRTCLNKYAQKRLLVKGSPRLRAIVIHPEILLNPQLIKLLIVGGTFGQSSVMFCTFGYAATSRRIGASICIVKTDSHTPGGAPAECVGQETERNMPHPTDRYPLLQLGR